MMRQTCRTVVVFSLLLILSAGPLSSVALGWSNGPAAGGVAGNGYGTHDWVLDEAIRLAGSDAAWLNSSVARKHSDDPDYKPKSDQLNHIYNSTRTGRGGPQTVANYYYEAVRAYQAGDLESASWLVGELSHYYSDLCQPYHTYRNDRSSKLAAEHLRYERAVDKSHRYPGAVRSWIKPVARTRVFDVRSRAISAALAARKDYPALRKGMKRGYSSSASSATGKITRRGLSRAANDLADIIASIPSASGMAATTRISSVTPSQSKPRQAANVAIRVKVVNQFGKARCGVRVKYTWRLGSKTVYTTSYTDSSGVATSWHAVRPAPRGKKAVISVTSTTNGVTTASSTSITPR